MNENKTNICSLCHGTGFYEEVIIDKNGKKISKRVKCENCDGTGMIPCKHSSHLACPFIFRKTDDFI